MSLEYRKCSIQSQNPLHTSNSIKHVFCSTLQLKIVKSHSQIFQQDLNVSVSFSHFITTAFVTLTQQQKLALKSESNELRIVTFRTLLPFDSVSVLTFNLVTLCNRGQSASNFRWYRPWCWVNYNFFTGCLFISFLSSNSLSFFSSFLFSYELLCCFYSFLFKSFLLFQFLERNVSSKLTKK